MMRRTLSPSQTGRRAAFAGCQMCGVVLIAIGQWVSGEPTSRSQDPAPVPQPFEAGRYSALIEKSPFAVSTAAPEPVAPTESFASNWKVNGLSKSRSADGSVIHTVFIQSRDLTTRFTLSGELPNADGISIASVEEAPIPTRSVVILRKGSETARVEFDQATVSASLAAPAGGPGVPPGAAGARLPGASVPPGVPPKSGAIRPSSIPRPNNPSAIPRPGVLPGANPGTSPASNSSRRVRAVEEPK